MGRVKTVVLPILVCIIVLSAVVSLNIYFAKRSAADDKNTNPINPEFANFNNKVFVSYGDSITYLGGFQEIVIKDKGMTHHNRGMNGTTVTDGVRGSVTHPAMSSQARLTEIQTLNPDIITIFGGMNEDRKSVV
jgi:hypothetical protein